MNTLPVKGGPLDGLEATPMGGFIRYISETGTVHREAAPGRHPYKRLSTHWTYAGHDHRTCECGAVVQRPAPGEPFVTCICGLRV